MLLYQAPSRESVQGMLLLELSSTAQCMVLWLVDRVIAGSVVVQGLKSLWGCCMMGVCVDVLLKEGGAAQLPFNYCWMYVALNECQCICDQDAVSGQLCVQDELQHTSVGGQNTLLDQTSHAGNTDSCS